MKNPYALILLVAATTAYGQINNPPTSVNIVDSTATGRAVLTATNAAAAATAIGLGTTNLVQFDRVDAVTVFVDEGSISFSGDAAATTRTNLGLGTTNAVTFGTLNAMQLQVSSGTNIYVNLADDVSEFFVPLQLEDQLAVVGAATFSTNVTINGNLSVGSLTTTTPSTWALDATQTAAATNGILALPSNANVIRLTNDTAISGVSGGVLGAFYYLVNQTTNAVTISNVGGITVQGGTPLTLGANQAATLVATGATNASVAARGDLNDVTLGGTANTAPSQTPSSGASLMTRDLADLRLFSQLAMLDQIRSDMGTVHATNGGGGTIDVNGFDLTTGTNSASSSLYQGYFGSKQTLSGTAGNTAWQGRVVTAWAFNRYNTNVEVRMQFGRNISVTNHGPLDERGMGIRVNGNNMFFETHDGTTHFETTNAVALSHNLGPEVFWAVSESGVARFYRGESTLLATVTNNVPTTFSAAAQRWVISISNTSTVSSGFRVRANPGYILQQ